ncbi:hypothetical protein tpqmel_0265 [Candidatus Gastranaerophilus sp. (ex Termes propinquus)]|nr:hypothetical protein tpqmel_0265 [Candidatus Gastranaerophilus sp. (ex Termes propinquus)]
MLCEKLLDNTDMGNFFITMAAAQDYKETKENLDKPKSDYKKVYKSIKSLLHESYFIGSLKYGNNFLA